MVVLYFYLVYLNHSHHLLLRLHTNRALSLSIHFDSVLYIFFCHMQLSYFSALPLLSLHSFSVKCFPFQIHNHYLIYFSLQTSLIVSFLSGICSLACLIFFDCCPPLRLVSCAFRRSAFLFQIPVCEREIQSSYHISGSYHVIDSLFQVLKT